MGIVRMGAPTEIISELRELYEIKKFVETGTFYGQTAYWASQEFEQVSTIEYSEEIYKQVTEKYKDVKNIEFLYGDSREKLREIIEKTNSPSIFWLDAHWSGDITYGEEDQCPIVEEIEIVNQSVYDNFIFIDDARLFLSPPQPPHRIEQWPDINTILTALNSGKDPRYTVVIEDEIIAVPQFAKSVIGKYCQAVNDRLWKEYGRQSKSTNLQKAMKLIYQDINKLQKIPKKLLNRIK